MDRQSIRVLALVLTFAAIVGGYAAVARPWHLRWGATDADVRAVLPGDDIVQDAVSQETRGITIDVGAEAVWPWVAQIGQNRGGFYSYDLLENLLGCQMPTSDHVRPDLGRWRIGEKLWMYPPYRAGGVGFATLRTYIPGYALAFGTHALGTPMTAPEDGSWAFVVQPLDRYTTRLLFRGRLAKQSLAVAAFNVALFEPAHFVMERRTLIGIKQLAEGRDRERWANHVQVLLWTITFALFLYSAVLTVRSRAWRRPFAGFFASALVFQVLTLLQPPIAVGTLLVTIVAATLWWPVQRRTALWNLSRAA
jgi:hypothetical protein